MGSPTIPLSISLVTYQTEPAELNQVLSSIADSKIVATVYVVDNSPTALLQVTAQQHNAVYLSSGKNVGFGSAHNIALKHIALKSKYHLILNPDVSFGPSLLSELFEFMEMNPEIGWVMPNILYPDGSKQSLCKRLPTPWDLFRRRFLSRSTAVNENKFECADLDLSRPRAIPSLSGCFAFVRTGVLQNVGGFDERFFMYLEDVDLVRRVGEVSRTVFYPYASAYHAHGRGSYRNLRLLGHHLWSTILYFSKWGWFIDPKRAAANRSIALEEKDIALPTKVRGWATN